MASVEREVRVGTDEIDLGDLALGGLDEVPLRVIAPAGTEVAGTRFVHAEGEAGLRLARMILDKEGRGRIVGLPRGRWKVYFSFEGLTGKYAEFEVTENPRAVRVDLTR